MGQDVWATLISSLFDETHLGFQLIPGHDVLEWALLCHWEYDDLDRELLDYETIGG